MKWTSFPRLGTALIGTVLGLSVASSVMAQTAGAPQSKGEPTQAASERDITQWLERMHNASRKHSYVGTFVVSSAAGAMASSRIWHTCQGDMQSERIESLTGTPRSTFRHNDQVITFFPQSRVVRIERRDALGLFPSLLPSGSTDIPAFYTARHLGSDRVAGFDADVVALQPRDALRFGYRVWSEKKSGLVITLQTLDTDGHVLEQAAFSELGIDVPVKVDKPTRLMARAQGYTVLRPELTRTTAMHEGWQLNASVPGFQPVSCYKRPVALVATPASLPRDTMQWVFSDGLATVSLFVEPFDGARHVREQEMAMGATHTVTKKVGTAWWLTVMGEAPFATLRLFAQALERSKDVPSDLKP